MEVIRKPLPPPTTTITVRVEVPVKKEYAKAREIAGRQPDIDMTTMISAAIADVCKAIIAAGGGKVTPISSASSSS